MQFLFGVRAVISLIPRLAKIAAKISPVRLQSCRDLQVLPASFIVSFADFAKAASQPRIRQRSVHRDSLLEIRGCGFGFIFGGEKKAVERQGLSIARGKTQTVFQRLFRASDMPQTELKFSDADPGK